GGIELSNGRLIRLREIHMEEDAGKLIHDPWTESTLADYNRCGVPLMEIVTQPDLRSPEEVIEFMQSLKSILEYAGVTDGKMHEGSLRADLNISVRRPGEEFGTRTEMKNMNSFKAIQRAVTVESERQIALIEKGERVLQETRRWDDNRDLSYPMRSKENAQDYRYFPEPDLPALHIDEAWLSQAHAALPEMPKAKRERYFAQYALPRHDVEILCQTHALTVLLERAIAEGASPKDAANWILSDVLRLCREREMEPAELALAPKALAEIIAAVNAGRVNRNGGRELLEFVFGGERQVEAAIAELKLELGGDESALGAAIAEVLAENPDAVANYRAGKVKVLGFLAGQCMQKLKGKADPRRVSELLREELAK
ncbi:MAG: Asp-tRNA(Asn)/Glu-tRNA(Gln) amidotransferase subunit GatB, partial [Christensenellaceae bacterium]|nr:Asp-tRNA(Asn)/Glu-tRNA(Gln) amidotransferase subunit GatB [Christensenellaceae bacterium]